MGAGLGKMRWERNHFAWEEELTNDLLDILQAVVLIKEVANSWVSQQDSAGSFSKIYISVAT